MFIGGIRHVSFVSASMTVRAGRPERIFAKAFDRLHRLVKHNPDLLPHRALVFYGKTLATRSPPQPRLRNR